MSETGLTVPMWTDPIAGSNPALGTIHDFPDSNAE